MINRIFVWTLIVLLFSMGLSLGSLDLSGSVGGENLSIDNPTTQSLSADIGAALADSTAPQITATNAGTELASYTANPPASADLEKLLPFNSKVSSSTSVFYKGSYLGWNGFTSQFPSTSAGLWIERFAGWSWYATMPWGAWARELLYVPITSPISMYEIYPRGFVTRYDLGVVQPGYYCLWYYADTPGRHLCVFGISSGYSNMIVIDVYGNIRPKPTPPKPDPKAECEARGFPWVWENGQCVMKMAPNPVAECEARGFPWVWENGKCIMKMAPNPVAECEKQPGCFWADGQCQCPPGPVPNPTPGPMPGPVPNPVAECEKQPGCYWADGQCQCPPGPVPNPTPEPMPGPEPNPNDDQGVASS